MWKVICMMKLARTDSKFMSTVPPIFLDQYSETLECTIVRLENDLGKTGQLCRSVPTVTTVNDDVGTIFHSFGH
jgi:hypothetical protein